MNYWQSSDWINYTDEPFKTKKSTNLIRNSILAKTSLWIYFLLTLYYEVPAQL
jgi:hypothetical protein